MFVQCIGGKGTRQPEGSITAPGAPAALKILATPVPSKQPPGMRESLVHHTYNICVPRSTSWKAVLNFHTNVMNDPIDVSGSFCLPSLSCHRGNCLIAKIIILFMTYLDQWWKQKCFWSPPPKKKQARQIHFGLGRLELHSYWYWFGICWCPGFGLVSSEIPLVMPLWLEDVHRELENDIITLFQASLQNLFPSALSPQQEGQHLPEAPKQTPLYVIDQKWATWALLAETKTEKASIWPVYWDASQGEGVLRGQSVASGLLLCKALLVVTQREKQVFISQYYLNRLPTIKIYKQKV